MITVALYARVSSEKQAQDNTIASQIAALEGQINEDGHKVLNDFKFIDNGYSGSHLTRPELERLRDKIAEGKIDKIYIHSPDRLSRKYSYQMILLEEFQKAGTEVIFLNCQTSDNPESQLLLQMQGMIAEYERAKIMERNRRGKIHAAKGGRLSVLSNAPFGYNYIDKHKGGGQAFFEINKEESKIVRKIYRWIGQERLSIGEVHRLLNKKHPHTKKGKKQWSRSTIWTILKNPAYTGQAAFGRKKTVKRLPSIRPKKGSSEHPKRNFSVCSVGKEHWIYIPVPAIIDEDLFSAVQSQLEENKKLSRKRKECALNLLQGLLVCQHCHYAFYYKKSQIHAYYRCTGTDGYRFGGDRICDNQQIRTETLDIAVWEEVKNLLKNPNRLAEEYHRRISELKKLPSEKILESIEKKENQLRRGISRLIDSYAQEYINKKEFEPRIKGMKEQLKAIEEQKKKAVNQNNLRKELALIITNLENFSSNIEEKLENIDWCTKRDIIRMVVKRIEINKEGVNVVFRVNDLPISNKPVRGNLKNWQHCPERRNFIHGFDIRFSKTHLGA